MLLSFMFILSQMDLSVVDMLSLANLLITGVLVNWSREIGDQQVRFRFIIMASLTQPPKIAIFVW